MALECPSIRAYPFNFEASTNPTDALPMSVAHSVVSQTDRLRNSEHFPRHFGDVVPCTPIHVELRRSQNENFGLHFRIAQRDSVCYSLLVVDVEHSSPASKAGIRINDKLIAVNDLLLNQLPLQSVLSILRYEMDHTHVKLTLSRHMAGAGFEDDENEMIRHPTHSQDHSHGLVPRTVRLIKGRDCRAFGLHIEHDTDFGHVIGKIMPGSCADISGVRQGDIIVQFGEEVILHLPYNVIKEKLQANKADEVTLSVVSRSDLLNAVSRNIPIFTTTDEVARNDSSKSILSLDNSDGSPLASAEDPFSEPVNNDRDQSVIGITDTHEKQFESDEGLMRDDQCILDSNGEDLGREANPPLSDSQCSKEVTPESVENNNGNCVTRQCAEEKPISIDVSRDELSTVSVFANPFAGAQVGADKQKDDKDQQNSSLEELSSSKGEEDSLEMASDQQQLPAPYPQKRMLVHKVHSPRQSIFDDTAYCTGFAKAQRPEEEPASQHRSAFAAFNVRLNSGSDRRARETPSLDQSSSCQTMTILVPALIEKDKSFGWKLHNGVERKLRINKIEFGSAAESAGFRVGDQLIYINSLRADHWKDTDAMEIFNRMVVQQDVDVTLKRYKHIRRSESTTHAKSEVKASNKENKSSTRHRKSNPYTSDSSLQPIGFESVRFRTVLPSPLSHLHVDQLSSKRLEEEESLPAFGIEKADDSPLVCAEHPRTVRILNTDSSMLGFDLKTITIEKDGRNVVMHALGNIVQGLPADLANVREADRLLAINGTSVDALTHDEVLTMIRMNVSDLRLEIKSDHTVKAAINDFHSQSKKDGGSKPPAPDSNGRSPLVDSADNGSILNSVLANDHGPTQHREVEVCVRPEKDSQFLGFSLTSQLRVHDVEPGSAAERAGVKKGDSVLAVNDWKVTPANRVEAFGQLKLGISESVVKLKLLRPLPRSGHSAILSGSPSIPHQEPSGRLCELVSIRKDENVGLSIKENHHGPHEIIAVVPKSPASFSGLNTGDLIIKVNGISVHGDTFESVKSLIRKGHSEGKLTLEVIDPIVYSEMKDQLNLSDEVSDINKNNSLNGVDGSPSSCSLVGAQRTPRLPMRDYPTAEVTRKLSSSQAARNSAASAASGVHLQRARTGCYFIKSMDDTSKAARAGLRADDVILSINGKQLSNLDGHHANSLFSNELLTSTNIDMVVRTNGHSDAICSIRGESVSWRIDSNRNNDNYRTESAKPPFLMGGAAQARLQPSISSQASGVINRFVSEPDIPAKYGPFMNGKDAGSVSKVEGTVNGRRRKIIQTIRRFCTPNANRSR